MNKCSNVAINGALCLLGRQSTNTSIWENFGFVKTKWLKVTIKYCLPRKDEVRKSQLPSKVKLTLIKIRAHAKQII